MLCSIFHALGVSGPYCGRSVAGGAYCVDQPQHVRVHQQLLHLARLLPLEVHAVARFKLKIDVVRLGAQIHERVQRGFKDRHLLELRLAE